MQDYKQFILKEISERYSVRQYLNKDVEEEKLYALLEAARLAPSARNYQNWTFVVIKDKKRRERLSEICKNQKFVAQAPVSIAIVAHNLDYVMTGGTIGSVVDAAIAGEHIALQAVKLGLGTCWIGAFYQDDLKQFLNAPKDSKIICLLTVGYPAHPPKKRRLKSFEEVVRFEKF